jgi:hypothetical protein
VSKIGVSTHVWPWRVFVIADLDTLLIALYVELTDRVIGSAGMGRRGPGKPPEVTDAELVCLAVAQVLLRMTMSGTGCAPRRPGSGTCSPGCSGKASTTSG